MNETIRLYIQGMVVVSSLLVHVSIGYLIIGLDYALLLAAICMITNFIPYFVLSLAQFPQSLALIASPLKAIEVIVTMVVANYVENHLIAPLVSVRSCASIQ